jgi:alkylation response protein AidB-like acyl-CoA dehydrogenase
MVIPEEFGGYGFSWRELAIVFEEMGRSLHCAPYFSTVALAATAILESGDDAAKRDLLPGIASGEAIATLALTEDSGRWDADGVATRATLTGDAWVLDGHKHFVLDGLTADVMLVVARSAAGLSLFSVQAEASGLTRTPLPTMDLTRKQAHLELSATPAMLVGVDGAAWPIVERTLQLASVALANEQAGGAQAALDMAVGYAKARFQFGRPIGSFQAIKHKCADLLYEVEGAKSAAYYAALVASEGDDDLAIASSVAKAYCSEAYFHTAAESIQIHGGIGYTWEHDAHLYFKRAKTCELLLGDPTYHRELIFERLGL